ncbi:MAG TPA: hypothetical protein VEL79_14190 [Vicinamibacterales bacterium]|nr:hypothetical protein [Vicinamibacterales bacterium]
MIGRRAGLSPALAAIGLMTLASVCAGQTPDKPPPGSLTLGPMTLTPALSVRDVGVDDNVFNEAVDPKRDFTFTLTPRADVVFRMRRLRLGYSTATDYVYYRKYVTERGVNTSSAARVDVNLGALKPYASVTGVNTRARLNTEVDARARHHDLVYAAGASVQLFSRTHLLVNGSETTVRFDPDASFRGVDLQESFDGTRRAVDGGFAVDLTPLTAFSVLVAREWQRFDLSPDRNSDTWRVSPTFTFSPEGLLTGRASIGFRRFRGASPNVPNFAGPVAAVGIGATIYGRNQLQADFNRDVQYSYDLITPYYVGTGGHVTWTTLVAGPVDMRGTFQRTLMHYRGLLTPGDDRTMSYGGGIGYRFSGHARLGINAEWARRDSDQSATRRYRNHRIFAGLTWGTTQ